MSSAQAKIIAVSFDQSMCANNNLPKSLLYQQLSHLYAQNNPDKLKPLAEPLIPKKIHQIWLGPLQIPVAYAEYSKTWQKLHPSWEYKLWRDKDIENWDFPSKDLYNKSSSYQEKSDILRYEILNKYGGLYVDMDYKAIKNFDELHYLYEFYGSIKPPIYEDNKIAITNGIIGSKPNIVILKKTLEFIREHWDAVEAGFREEAKHLGKKEAIVNLAINRTGMPFHRAIMSDINFVKRAIIFPPTYMRIMINDKINSFTRFSSMSTKKLYYHTIHPETLAVHDQHKYNLVTNLSDIEIKEPWYRPVIKTLNSFFSLN
jgi:mannosyltransferase OCH1-like enzyme